MSQDLDPNKISKICIALDLDHALSAFFNCFFRHYFGTILQFQLFRAMCLASREYVPNNPDKPLHKCDLYRHPEAGDILKWVQQISIIWFFK